jgi:hypothetical protein
MKKNMLIICVMMWGGECFGMFNPSNGTLQGNTDDAKSVQLVLSQPENVKEVITGVKNPTETQVSTANGVSNALGSSTICSTMVSDAGKTKLVTDSNARIIDIVNGGAGKLVVTDPNFAVNSQNLLAIKRKDLSSEERFIAEFCAFLESMLGNNIATINLTVGNKPTADKGMPAAILKLSDGTNTVFKQTDLAFGGAADVSPVPGGRIDVITDMTVIKGLPCITKTATTFDNTFYLDTKALKLNGAYAKRGSAIANALLNIGTPCEAQEVYMIFTPIQHGAPQLFYPNGANTSATSSFDTETNGGYCYCCFTDENGDLRVNSNKAAFISKASENIGIGITATSADDQLALAFCVRQSTTKNILTIQCRIKDTELVTSGTGKGTQKMEQLLGSIFADLNALTMP